MAWSLGFLVARLAGTIVFLLTWVYGVTALSPFAFDMFVKPRLFPWLEDFVAWHHLWYLAAVLVTTATLAPILAHGLRGLSLHMRAAWWASVAYIVVFGLASAHLLATPHLALLASGTRDLLVVPGALLPLLWLAVIDHLVEWPPTSGVRSPPVTGQRRLLTACLGSAGVLWLANALRGATSPTDAHSLVWALSSIWGLTITAAMFVGVYLVLALSVAMASTTRRPFAWEYGLVVALLAILVTEFFRRIVFPPLLLGAGDAALTAVPLGVVMALTIAGLRLRTANATVRQEKLTALDIVLAFRGRGALPTLLLLAVPAGAGIALSFVERIDWAMTLQRLIVIVEATVVFGLMLHVTRRLQGEDWSMRSLLVPPAAALLALHAVPHVARAAVDATGDGRADPQQLIDRYQSTAVLTSLGARALVAQMHTDPGFYGDLLDAETRLSNLDPVPPGRPSTTATSRPETRPHVFLFVIDSLRRDYLSPYNDAVTFTPSIARWANNHFVFRNAFTPYGGTWLAIPSLWTGSAVTRRWMAHLPELNIVEPLIVAEDYDFVINDYTIAEALHSDTRRTFLDPSIPSVDTDLCRNLNSVEAHFSNRADTRPMFVYFAPMNVHILNTRNEAIAQPTAGYDGFFAPYASRLERLDDCFGRFIAFLKHEGLYDNSLIILTSDHGDSLGADGRWGHQFYLFPEDIRIPLIVQLPAAMRSEVTADLGEVAFLTDIAPTLYALFGYPVREPGPGIGAPLFVPADQAPVSRRRESFLVMSSYGSSYGMLRRNGRHLYITDMVNRWEEAFTLFREPLGEQVPAGDALRRLNQQEILRGLAEVERLYRAPEQQKVESGR